MFFLSWGMNRRISAVYPLFSQVNTRTSCDLAVFQSCLAFLMEIRMGFYVVSRSFAATAQSELVVLTSMSWYIMIDASPDWAASLLEGSLISSKWTSYQFSCQVLDPSDTIMTNFVASSGSERLKPSICPTYFFPYDTKQMTLPRLALSQNGFNSLNFVTVCMLFHHKVHVVCYPKEGRRKQCVALTVDQNFAY